MAKQTARRKRTGVNKSQAIRDYLAANPNAMPKEIMSALHAKRIMVSAALVSAVKYGAKRNGPKKTASRRKKQGSSALTATDLIQAKALADQLGGVAKAKAALETLEKLR